MLADLGRVACPCVYSLNLWQSTALVWKDNWYSLPSSPPSEVSFHAVMWRVGKGGPHGLLDTQLIHWDHRETRGRKAPYQEVLSEEAQWKCVFLFFFFTVKTFLRERLSLLTSTLLSIQTLWLLFLLGSSSLFLLHPDWLWNLLIASKGLLGAFPYKDHFSTKAVFRPSKAVCPEVCQLWQ